MNAYKKVLKLGYTTIFTLGDDNKYYYSDPRFNIVSYGPFDSINELLESHKQYTSDKKVEQIEYKDNVINVDFVLKKRIV